MLRRKEDISYTFSKTPDNGIDAFETAGVLANLPITKGPHKFKAAPDEKNCR